VTSSGKYTATFGALAMLFAVTACGKSDEPSKPPAANQPPVATTNTGPVDATTKQPAAAKTADAATRTTRLPPPKSPCYGRALCRKHCDAGHVPSCVRLGEYLDEAWGAKRDKDGAHKLWRSACENGDGDGCLFAGTLNTKAGKARYARGIELYKKACEAGDGERCELVARIYASGRIVTVRTLESWNQHEKYVVKGCEHGHPESCEWMTTGLVLTDERRAKLERKVTKLRQGRCKAGEARSCRALATANLLNADGARYQAAANAIWTRQCKAGYKRSCERIDKVSAKAAASRAVLDALFPGKEPAIPKVFGKLRPWMTKKQVESLAPHPSMAGKGRYSPPAMPGVQIDAAYSRGYERFQSLTLSIRGHDAREQLRARWGTPVMSHERDRQCWFSLTNRLRACASGSFVRFSAVTTVDDILGKSGSRLGVERSQRLYQATLEKLKRAYPNARLSSSMVKGSKQDMDIDIPGSECRLDDSTTEVSVSLNKQGRAIRLVVEVNCFNRPGLRPQVLKKFARRAAQLERAFPKKVYQWNGPLQEIMLAIGWKALNTATHRPR